MDGLRLGEILRELSFTSSLSDSARARIGEIATLACFPVGSVLFREGGGNPNFFLIREGRVGLDMNVPGRGPVRILTLGPGDMVGWSALIGSGEMTTSAMALENTEVIVCPGKKLMELSASNHEIGYQFMNRVAMALAHRLTSTRLQLLDLFEDPPPVLSAMRGESRGER